ncbi:bifunctional 2-keto-4-hydroxyglutarate aldolase/2-keto-3-deoxy-6-phosphogluconate aldolase [Massilia sp. MB5]|nr:MULTISPECIES: bifunctional 2-keto-4-hydroxyglutarate aldolase/2-keto-3-deoxy-6-phosphogluconate aldolase [unclassified Massilia]AKU23136.1 ketohydroxyglutarate aldolase [Massilia sp. NR 4-1]UMR31960.1 bifunctional 2-keto-4-hydroxyglutarate aldolase/2-keto-3-deoxy-6-phosphogluconate aldolase [Massilia sp. MB5]
MMKLEVLQAIREAGMVAIVRADSAQEALLQAEACIEGGVRALEVAFTTPGALDVIKALRERHAGRVLIGAGTVLDTETARLAILAGAQFMIAPNVNVDVIRLCNRYQIVSMPGALTPTEVVQAAEAGADIVKVFPADAVGPHYVAALRAPLPHIALMPTGGVTLENLGTWFKYGAVAVGIGGSMTGPAKKGNYAEVTANAAAFVARLAAIRKEAAGA